MCWPSGGRRVCLPLPSRYDVTGITSRVARRKTSDDGNCSRCREDPATSAPHPPLAAGVGPQGPQEIDPAEVRPERLTEVELAVRALPEQEPAQALLPG